MTAEGGSGIGEAEAEVGRRRRKTNAEHGMRKRKTNAEAEHGSGWVNGNGNLEAETEDK